jgi:hypothetical protein
VLAVVGGRALAEVVLMGSVNGTPSDISESNRSTDLDGFKLD